MVRLRQDGLRRHGIGGAFQFLMVRLRLTPKFDLCTRLTFSIPYGTIKTFPYFYVNSPVDFSIPYGTIKTKDAGEQSLKFLVFQFLMVRLRL